MSRYRLKRYKVNLPIIVQAKNTTEAKPLIEQRMQAYLLHPDGISLDYIQEIKGE